MRGDFDDRFEEVLRDAVGRARERWEIDLSLIMQSPNLFRAFCDEVRESDRFLRDVCEHDIQTALEHFLMDPFPEDLRETPTGVLSEVW